MMRKTNVKMDCVKKGKIIRIISNQYTVNVNEENIECQARGKFRQEKITPLVGDYCEVDTNTNYILKILERKNCLNRPNIANIDCALIVSSLKQPDFSPYLLDKMLSIITLYNIIPIICFTKKDLCDKDEKKQIAKIANYYQEIGYTVFYNDNIEPLKKSLQGKTLVVTGQTGAGKSTLLNRLDPNLNLKTSPISKALNRGVHTTRHTEIYKIKDFYIADTPGFSALDFIGFNETDIRNSFKEFSEYPCKFKDCLHLKEKDCNVKKAVEENLILKNRYESYQTFIKEIQK